MIQTAVILLFALLTGLLLGALYFWGLWYTVRRLPDSEKPFKLMFISYTLRVAIVLAGLFFVMAGHWERLAVAMAGFLIMREILMHRWGGRKAILE